MPAAVQILPLSGLPLLKPGDDLPRLIVDSARKVGWGIREKDVLVVGQKAVSKAEGRLVNLGSVHPSKKALVLARKTGRKPEFVQIVLNDSKRVVRADKMALIVTTKHGWTCLNAGVDKSNVKGDQNYALLPTHPDASARRIRSRIRRLTGKDVGVIITDTHSRPFRLGQVEETIGIAGLKPHADYRGQRDLFGYQLKFKNVALADEVAGAAELVMGQGREAIPAAIVRGWSQTALTHGSVARGDVDDKSDVDVLIPSNVNTQILEAALENAGFTIFSREIAQATPSHSPKAHIQLDAEQTTSVTVPLTPFRSLELEFYTFGGRVTLPELKNRIRNPGCTKKLVLIEPTPEGHFETPVVGRENEVARLLGVSVAIVMERVRVLTRRDTVGRTGMYLRIPVRDGQSFEKVLQTRVDSDPALRRTLRTRS